ncbi:Hypothetical protein CINCED_3A006234 [Cinara cedri]|uniref:Uncharacterized protein n=1 Tax=Cinara cedri TaxID=506608 RepID=A0A5E4N4K4_9HEMI|nr:Hypothetical protein CINCED_3A006234 [Cinara cedri]
MRDNASERDPTNRYPIHLPPAYGFSHRRVGSPCLFNHYPTKLISPSESKRKAPITARIRGRQWVDAGAPKTTQTYLDTQAPTKWMIIPHRRRSGVYRHARDNTIFVARDKWAAREHPTLRPNGRNAKRPHPPSNDHVERRTCGLDLSPDITSVEKFRHSPTQREFVHVRFAPG